MFNAGIDGGVKQYKSAGTIALPQGLAEGANHALLQSGNVTGGIRQLFKGDVLLCQIAFQQPGRLLGKMDPQDGGFFPVGGHIPLKDLHLQRKGLRSFFFGTAEPAA